ncbi:MAG TPA: hypothetical protein VFV38_08585 [Ktedonobacteraceae bacterium]|nr:hypothetical protein [Ktedonobacteraceae bacterium]
MPQLLRLRFCNIGPHRARMEDLTLSLEDITTGQATHSAILLRNGGGKTTLISLMLWLLCPDKPMPDKNQIDDYVQFDDRSVLVAEWQMDQQLSLWTGKPGRYLTGVFCEWRPAATQEGRKLERFFFATRVLEDEPCLSLEHLPLFVTKHERRERRSLTSFRQEWRELDHTYPQAEVEYTDRVTRWREILERIGVDPELFRYQIRMNTREGGAAEPFMFKENERFVDFFLELMGEAATGDEIATTIKTFCQELLYLRQQLDPEYELLQTLTQQLTFLCEIAGERDHLYDQLRSAHKEIKGATLAVNTWIEHWQQEQEMWEQQEQIAHEEHLRQKEEAGQRRRRVLLLRYAAAGKRVQRLQADVIALQNLVQEKKRQVIIWQAAIPLRVVIRSRAKAEGIEKQLRALLQEHEPLLHTLQVSARRYAAALSAKVEHLRAEEQRLEHLAYEQRALATQLRDQSNGQLMAAQGYDAQANTFAGEREAFRALRKQMEEHEIMLAGENWEQAQTRLLQQQSERQEEQDTFDEAIQTLEQEQEDIQEKLNGLNASLSGFDTQIRVEQNTLKPAQKARQQIANDPVLRQYLEIPELDFDQLTPQALEILRKERDAAEERIAQLRLSLMEQEAMIDYLSVYGFLPPAQVVTQVLAFLKKEHVTAWSGWQYLAESIREADRRAFLQRLPELAFGIVLPDEQWEQAHHLLQTTAPYLETPVVIFTRQTMQENVSAHGWAIGPTSDAYFNPDAGSRELLARQERLQEQRQQRDNLARDTSTLKRSLDLLEHTFEHYPTSWWQQHQRLLADAQKQKSSIERQLRMQEQELQLAKSQIAGRKEEIKRLQAMRQQVRDHLTQLQARKTQLTIDPDALQEREYQLRAQASTCRDEAQKLRKQADNQEDEANHTSQEEKSIAEEATLRERERSDINYLEGEPPVAHLGDIQSLRDQYESLVEQYQQKIGPHELRARHEDALKELQQANLQLKKKLPKSVSEQEVQDTLNTLADPEEADQRADEAFEAKFNAENESKEQQKQLSSAENGIQEIKKKLLTQGISENEGGENIPASEQRCAEEAEEEERMAASNEQAALHQKNTELVAQQKAGECSLRMESLGRVQKQIRTMQSGYAPLLAAVAMAEADMLPSSEAEQIAFREEDIDDALQGLESRLKQMQEKKAELDNRASQRSQVINRALNEVNSEFKEVTLARRLLEHEEGAFEQHCRVFLAELSDRLRWVAEQRQNLQIHRDALVQQLLALAEAGIAFLNSATKYSKLPATLPDFEQRPFLRIHLTEHESREERVGKIADYLDALIKEKEIPSGIQLLQQVVRRLASPMSVQVLFPDPGNLHYVAPTRLMKESGGERLTSMVLLYCTLLRMRAVYRTKPAGKSGCLILDNPMGVASRALFLKLQREVAQAMNIQLIYTTAIKDFGALDVFPNIIRIRNDQRDRRTGNQLLMLDTSLEGLETIRIMHSESRDFARDRQDRQS